MSTSQFWRSLGRRSLGRRSLGWCLLTLAVVIMAAPLLIPGLDGTFSGTDDQAMQVIAALAPEYTPWFDPLWELPGSEMESLLFALQAALGSGVLGYVIGRLRGRTPVSDRRDEP